MRTPLHSTGRSKVCRLNKGLVSNVRRRRRGTSLRPPPAVSDVAASASRSRENAELPEQVGVVEVDPRVADLALPDFIDGAAAERGLSPGGQDVGQRAQMGSRRAPADDHVLIA